MPTTITPNSPGILFEIHPGGKVNFQVSGVKGATCEEVSEPYRSALGNRVHSSSHTPEYYEEQELTQEQGLDDEA